MTNTILLALVPIFFVMVLGYGAGRLRIVDSHHVEGLNALVMNFALPASLFAATASAPRSELFAQVPLFVVLGVVMMVVFLLAWYWLQYRSSQVSRADASLQALTIAFPNLAGVGLPILSDVLGPAGTVPVAVALASGSILVSPLALLIVELSGRGGGTATPTARMRSALWHALTKPVVLAPALGILFSLCELKTGRIIEACLLLIGQAAPGVALFLTGLILSGQSFRSNWTVVGEIGLGNIIRPLLTAAVVFVLPVPSETAKVAILLSALPSGFFGILFAVNYKLDSATVGSIVIASTGFSIVTMAIAIAVLFPS